MEDFAMASLGICSHEEEKATNHDDLIASVKNSFREGKMTI